MYNDHTIEWYGPSKIMYFPSSVLTITKYSKWHLNIVLGVALQTKESLSSENGNSNITRESRIKRDTQAHLRCIDKLAQVKLKCVQFFRRSSWWLCYLKPLLPVLNHVSSVIIIWTWMVVWSWCYPSQMINGYILIIQSAACSIYSITLFSWTSLLSGTKPCKIYF